MRIPPKKSVPVVALLLVLALMVALVGSTTAASVEPTYVEKNPTCEELGYAHGFKVDPPKAGTYSIPGYGSVTVATDGVYFDWSSTIGIDAVIAKGGPNANVYKYDPPAEKFEDKGLVSPINPNNGKPYGLSHITFCYDYEVEVIKTADTSFTRTWDWTIEKVGDQTAVVLATGQNFPVNYDVTVDATYRDSDWAVDGNIEIYNPAPYVATITGVSDVVSSGIEATVDCPVDFPYDLAAGGTLTCTYRANLPDAANRTNTATVTTSGKVGGGEDTVDVIFGEPTTKVNECIAVYDDKGDPENPYYLGSICADDAPYTFEYSLSVGPYAECGQYEFENTASFGILTDPPIAPPDLPIAGSDSWTVSIDVPCVSGCTLTQGYWKTHSMYGPAPYDDTWALLGEDTSFYLSGQTYYEVLWTAPKGGNAYYQLAHQYIAAKLNLLSGAASTSAVDNAMDAAADLFGEYTPAEVAEMKGKAGNATRDAFRILADTLDQFNNGLIGPGHCSE